MADPVAIISVSTAGAIGLGSLVKDLVLPRWQSNEERTTEARTVLDAAGRFIIDAVRATDSAKDYVLTPENEYHDEGTDPSSWLDQQLDTMWDFEAQLAVRFGPEHDITKYFEQAHEALRYFAARLSEAAGGAALDESYFSELNRR